MKKKEVFCVVLILSLTMSCWAAIKESANFPYKYDGDVIPDTAGFTYGGTLPFGDYASTDGDILTLDTNSVSGGQQSYWYKNPGLSDATKGYTVEARLKVLSSPDQSTDVNRGFWLSAAFPGYSGVILSFFNASVMHRAGGDEMILYANNTDGFHTYRLSIKSGGIFDLYRDGAKVVADRAIGVAWEEIGFGDPTSNGATPDMSVKIDYIRWDTTGAYEPNYTPPQPKCGDPGTVYLPMDYNLDCYVNFVDLAAFSQEWLKCTDSTQACSN